MQNCVWGWFYDISVNFLQCLVCVFIFFTSTWKEHTICHHSFIAPKIFEYVSNKTPRNITNAAKYNKFDYYDKFVKRKTQNYDHNNSIPYCVWNIHEIIVIQYYGVDDTHHSCRGNVIVYYHLSHISLSMHYLLGFRIMSRSHFSHHRMSIKVPVCPKSI